MERPRAPFHVFPTKAGSGSLRLTRHGSRLTYWAAEGSGEFRELDSIDFTPQPIRAVQIYAQPGGAANRVSVRFSELIVRAETILRLNQLPPSGWQSIKCTLTVFFAAASSLAGWLWWKKKGSRADEKGDTRHN